jgi:hypothetical protein
LSSCPVLAASAETINSDRDVCPFAALIPSASTPEVTPHLNFDKAQVAGHDVISTKKRKTRSSPASSLPNQLLDHAHPKPVQKISPKDSPKKKSKHGVVQPSQQTINIFFKKKS